MEGHRENYHNDITYHAAFHGVKIPRYISDEVIAEKAERLREIQAEEAKQGKTITKLLENIKKAKRV